MARVLLILLFVWAQAISAAELPRPYDALGQVKLLQGLMAQKPGNYFIQPIDLFEGDTVYKTRAASTQLSDIRFVDRVPDSKGSDAEALDMEEDLLLSTNPNRSFKKSMMIHSSFVDPGKQVYWFMPDKPVPLSHPVRFSMWIHSQGYMHSLTLLFKDQFGREIRVGAGRLDWKGWKRIWIDAPVSLQRQNRLYSKKTATFTGFVVESSSYEEASDFALMFDNFIALSEIETRPAGDVIDTWE